MTMHTAHPIQHTACVAFRSYGGSIRRIPMMRRIAGITLSHCHIDVLQNTERVQRPSWDYSLSLAGYTLAVVRKG